MDYQTKIELCVKGIGLGLVMVLGGVLGLITMHVQLGIAHALLIFGGACLSGVVIHLIMEWLRDVAETGE